MTTTLDSQILNRIEAGDEVFIGVLAAGGYEFAVGLLAVLALGAAAVPMGEFGFSLILGMLGRGCIGERHAKYL